jgi:hypothetical protein
MAVFFDTQTLNIEEESASGEEMISQYQNFGAARRK